LGNPTLIDEVSVEITGVEGQEMRIGLVNSQGQLVGQQIISKAHVIERQTMKLGRQPGVYILQVSTATGRKSVKLLRN
jgi:hypothetical protein